MENFRLVQGNGYFLVIGKECKIFTGNIEDYVFCKEEDYINCAWLTHKTNKTLSGLIR